jgi:hypothetical protein
VGWAAECYKLLFSFDCNLYDCGTMDQQLAYADFSRGTELDYSLLASFSNVAFGQVQGSSNGDDRGCYIDGFPSIPESLCNLNCLKCSFLISERRSSSYLKDAAFSFLYKTHLLHFYTNFHPVESSKRIQQGQLLDR